MACALPRYTLPALVQVIVTRADGEFHRQGGTLHRLATARGVNRNLTFQVLMLAAAKHLLRTLRESVIRSPTPNHGAFQRVKRPHGGQHRTQVRVPVLVVLLSELAAHLNRQRRRDRGRETGLRRLRLTPFLPLGGFDDPFGHRQVQAGAVLRHRACSYGRSRQLPILREGGSHDLNQRPGVALHLLGVGCPGVRARLRLLGGELVSVYGVEFEVLQQRRLIGGGRQVRGVHDRTVRQGHRLHQAVLRLGQQLNPAAHMVQVHLFAFIGGVRHRVRQAHTHQLRRRPGGVHRLLEAHGGRIYRGRAHAEEGLEKHLHQLLPEGLHWLRRHRSTLPAVGAHRQQVTGTGHRHVHEAAVLQAGVLGGIIFMLAQVVFQVLRFLEGGNLLHGLKDRRKVLAVATQRPGQSRISRHLPQVRGLPAGRATAQTRQKHMIPLQALRSVHGHQLHRVRVRLHRTQRQALLLIIGTLKPRKETHHVAHAARRQQEAARTRVAFLRAHAVRAGVNHRVNTRRRHAVGGGNLVESVQVRARTQRVDTRADRQLNIEQHGPLNLVQQRAQILTQTGTQHAHLLSKSTQTLQRRRGETAAAVLLTVEGFAVRAVLRQVLHRLNEGGVAGGILHRALEGFVQALLGGTQVLRLQADSRCVVGVFSLGEHTQRHLLTQGTLTLTHQRLRPITQRQHIRRAQTPTRTRQQTRQGIRTVRIRQHTQRRHQIHNLRLGEQTAQTHLLHRNAQTLALHTNRVQLTVHTCQHRNLGHLQARTHRTIAGTMRRVGALILAHRLRTHRRNTLGDSHSLLAVRVVVRQINTPHHARGCLFKSGRTRLPHQGAARAQVRNLSGGNIAVGGTHPLGNLLQLLRHVVCRVQHRNVVTPRNG